MGLTVLDTGVLIGFLDSADAHHSRAVAALTALGAKGDRGVVPASAYAELLVRPFRRGARHVKLVDEALDAFAFSIEPISRAVAKAAAQLRATHGTLRLPDALVLATARTVKASRVITTDAGWPKVAGLRVETLLP